MNHFRVSRPPLASLGDALSELTNTGRRARQRGDGQRGRAAACRTKATDVRPSSDGQNFWLVSLFPRRQTSPAASRVSTKSGLQPAGAFRTFVRTPPRSLRPQPRGFSRSLSGLRLPLFPRPRVAGNFRPSLNGPQLRAFPSCLYKEGFSVAGARAWAAGRLATARNFRALGRSQNAGSAGPFSDAL